MQHSKSFLLASLFFDLGLIVGGEFGEGCMDFEGNTGYCYSPFVTPSRCFGYGIPSDVAWGDCYRVSCKSSGANIKLEKCCVTRFKKGNFTLSCRDLLGEPCGPFARYGEMYSRCCQADDADQSLEVVYCDVAGITLVTKTCPEPFACIERIGYTNKNKRTEEEYYAQCEKPT
jgi:hypothetical protein